MDDAKLSIVAFLDILGFGSLIANKIHDSEFLKRLDHTIEQRIKIISGGNTSILKSIEARMFSDCFCVSCVVGDNISNAIDFLAALACFQRYLAWQGIYTRGGVDLDLHFSTPRIIFSQALVNAYAIESKIAKYPRVVLSKRLLENVQRALENYSGYFFSVAKHTPEHFRTYYDSLIWKDRDGEYFFNFYADMHGFDSSASMFQEAWGHKESVEKWISNGLQEGKNQSKLDKYEWLIEYHNKAIEPFSEDDDYRVSKHILSICS